MDVAVAGRWDEMLSKYDGSDGLSSGAADLLLPSVPIACGATAAEDQEASVGGMAYRCGAGESRRVRLGSLEAHSFPTIARCGLSAIAPA